MSGKSFAEMRSESLAGKKESRRYQLNKQAEITEMRERIYPQLAALKGSHPDVAKYIELLELSPREARAEYVNVPDIYVELDNISERQPVITEDPLTTEEIHERINKFMEHREQARNCATEAAHSSTPGPICKDYVTARTGIHEEYGYDSTQPRVDVPVQLSYPYVMMPVMPVYFPVQLPILQPAPQCANIWQPAPQCANVWQPAPQSQHQPAPQCANQPAPSPINRPTLRKVHPNDILDTLDEELTTSPFDNLDDDDDDYYSGIPHVFKN
jgi:hypothetical protein